jgi:hypothetical protein
MARKSKSKATKPKINSRIIGGEKYTPRRLNAHYKGDFYETYTYDIKPINNKGISTADANAFSRDLLKRKRTKNGLYRVSYTTGSGLIIYSKFDPTQVIPDFEKYGLDESDFTIVGITINSIRAPKTKGGFKPFGNDINNDCLYYAVKHSLANK